MSKYCRFTVWDENCARGAMIVDMLVHALNQCNIKNDVSIQTEPPLIARKGLYGHTPAIEFEDNTWESKSKVATQEGINILVARLFMD